MMLHQKCVKAISNWPGQGLSDVAVLIGAGRTPGDFSNDSLARTLDKFARADRKRVQYLGLSKPTVREDMTLNVANCDNTFRTIYGLREPTGPMVQPAYRPFQRRGAPI